MKKWQHNELAEDLARHMRSISDRLVWTNLPMGAVHSVRPDVFTLPKSYGAAAMAYEIKISVSDFRSDATTGKWQEYLRYAAGVYFAVPQGLIGVKDLPAGAGLIVRTEDSWKAIKKPTLQKQPDFSKEVWMKLLMDGCKRENARFDVEPRVLNEWAVADKIRKKHGHEIAQALSDRTQAVRNLRHTIKLLDDERATHEALRTRLMTERSNEVGEMRKQAQEVIDELAHAIGLPPGQDIWSVKYAVRQAVQRLHGDGETALLRKQLDDVKKALARAEFPIGGPEGPQS